MLELGNALGFLIGPLLVPNPPVTSWENQTRSERWLKLTILDVNDQNAEDKMSMRHHIMNLMYSRKIICFQKGPKGGAESSLCSNMLQLL